MIYSLAPVDFYSSLFLTEPAVFLYGDHHLEFLCLEHGWQFGSAFNTGLDEIVYFLK